MYRILWGVVVAICILSIVIRFNPDRLQTNLFDLLPKQAEQQTENEAIDAYSERLSRKIGILIGASDHVQAVAIAQQIEPLLQQSAIFSQINAQVSSEQLKSLYLSYYPYRFNLLSDASVNSLKSSGQWLINRLINAIASPITGLNSNTLLDDPFLLFQDYLVSLPKGNPHIAIENGYPTVKLNNVFYILISAELNASPFDQSLQDNYRILQSKINSEIKLSSNQSVDIFGVIRHAMENREMAQREMTVIGTGSLLGILVLFLLVFERSLRQLLILLPIATGIVFSLAVSMLVFNNIHLISLVFGVSLIGVSIDYAIHYSCANSSLSGVANGHAAIRKIRMALTLGLLTSIAGYLTLTTTEFPALRQMATIAIAGLVGAYLTVLLWMPALLNKPQQVRIRVSQLALKFTAWLGTRKKTPVWLLMVVLVAVFALVLGIKQGNDDIKMMRASLPHLDAIDSRFKTVLEEYPNSQFILVHGDTENQLLASETQLASSLRSDIHGRGRIEAISDWLPTQESQLQNRRLLQMAIGGNHALDTQLQEAGIPEEILHQYRATLKKPGTDLLTVDKFLDSPLGKLKSDAWLGRINNKYYSIITLHGFDDLSSVEQVVDSVGYADLIDRLKTVSDTFRFYRIAIEEIFPFVIGVVFILLLIRYGANGAFRVISAPLLAALASFITVHSMLGQYNLFTIFGLIITIAISIDYAIFIREARENDPATYLAITLAGMTTILAFGLLALSRTPALNTFGMTLLFGIAFSYLFTPIIVIPGRRAV